MSESTTTPDFDAIRAERDELNTLIERGVSFTVAKRSWLRRIGKPHREFVLKQPYLGTLDYLSREYIEMDFNEANFSEGQILSESKRLMARNATRCARIVALAILNDYWGIRLLSGLLSRYLLWHVTPQKLFQLTILINQISNVADFTNSIRFLSVSRTTAPPTRIETAGAKQPG